MSPSRGPSRDLDFDRGLGLENLRSRPWSVNNDSLLPGRNPSLLVHEKWQRQLASNCRADAVPQEDVGEWMAQLLALLDQTGQQREKRHLLPVVRDCLLSHRAALPLGLWIRSLKASTLVTSHEHDRDLPIRALD